MPASPFEGLTPALVFGHLEALTRIPRCSGNEAATAEHIINWAKQKGFSHKQDELGNVVVGVPGTAGLENAPTVVLQGHLDMVGEKDSDSPHNFDTDPIPVLRDGDFLTADRTTLGADNGIGLAAAMAVAEDPDAKRGPLELLCTVDEETGLTGAAGLQAGFVTGKTMLNLDSEEIGAVYVGCAGGADTNCFLTLERGDGEGTPYMVKVGGLRGGHSGLDINTGRANAIQVVAWMLDGLRRAGVNFQLIDVAGGDKHNAIPREATAVLLLAPGDVDAAQAVAASQLDDLKVTYGKVEPDATITLETTKLGDKAMAEASRDALIDLLLALPHGVLTMSQEVEGLVETSTDLAVVRIEGDEVKIQESSRSSVMPALARVQEGIFAAVRLAGGTPKSHGGYPGWQPDMDSPVLERTKAVHAELFGDEPEVKAIHAGLECGIIGEKMGGMDMISFGPEIHNPHSPSECLKISTVAPFYDLLKGLLASLAA